MQLQPMYQELKLILSTLNFKSWEFFLEWFKECLHDWFVFSKPQASHHQVVHLSDKTCVKQGKHVHVAVTRL